MEGKKTRIKEKEREKERESTRKRKVMRRESQTVENNR
jgi:hypothetical protein